MLHSPKKPQSCSLGGFIDLEVLLKRIGVAYEKLKHVLISQQQMDVSCT